ncbi:MAG: prepilin-type N-terminal cleavage/methylation domain-containing protein [Trueperaceae bacterium]|nr:prepilin-type N-terminal cleavage/methylation domain-containing protein [Trueperaceae bacterium]
MVRTSPARRRSSAGFSILELLVVLAILAVAFGLVAVAGRGILQRSAERSVVNTVQQAVWQGATMAAARGVRTELVRDGDVLAVRRLADGEVLRTFDLEPGATLNVDDGQVLVFTPPGSVLESSLDALPDPVTITAAGATYELEVSLIGEVRVR